MSPSLAKWKEHNERLNEKLASLAMKTPTFRHGDGESDCETGVRANSRRNSLGSIGSVGSQGGFFQITAGAPDDCSDIPSVIYRLVLEGASPISPI